MKFDFKRYVFFLLSLSVGLVAYAQTDEDLLLPEDRVTKEPQKYENKLDKKTSFQAGLGLYIFSGNERINSFGQPQNILGGFKPGPVLQLGIWYHYKADLVFGPDVNIGFFSKTYYSKLTSDIGIATRYYVLDRLEFEELKKIRPYLYGGVYATWVRLTQQEHIDVIIPPGDKSLDFGDPIQFENRYSDQTYVLGPSPRFKAGIGLEYKLDRKYSLFIQAGIQPALLNRSTLSEEYPRQRGMHNAFALHSGVTIRLMKDKPQVFDTTLIQVPDLVAWLDFDEERIKQNMLIREGLFDVILREGLAHHVHVDAKDHEIIIEEHFDSRCTVTCYLYDENGNILSRSESTPEGKVVFSNIENGIYDLAFVLEKPCKEQNFAYTIPNPHTEILMQFNADFHQDDSLLYTIKGNVIMPDSADLNFIYKNSALFLASNTKMLINNYDVKVYLADAKGKILAEQDPDKKLHFIFRNLPQNKYEIVYKVPDAEVHTGMTYSITDQFLTPVKSVFSDDFSDTVRFKRQTEEAQYDRMKYLCKGKVKITDSSIKMAQIQLMLVNQKGKVVSTKKPDADGSFVFKNLKSKYNYKVYYDLDDRKGEIQLHYTFEEPVAFEANLITVEVSGMPDISVGDDEIKTVDLRGRLLFPVGYTVQVGAYENVRNVDRLCRKLRQEGFSDFYIQVGWTVNMNKRFVFYRNFKIYKVMVGDFKSEKEAKRLMQKLDSFGFDAFVRQHHKAE